MSYKIVIENGTMTSDLAGEVEQRKKEKAKLKKIRR